MSFFNVRDSLSLQQLQVVGGVEKKKERMDEMKEWEGDRTPC